MKNNARCIVIGIGTVHVRMFDGVIRTLSEVRHVSDMRKNLISLGTLDAKGFKYSSADRLMKIAIENLIVMKAQLSDSLYVLQGSTMTDSAAVTSSSMSNLNSTRL